MRNRGFAVAAACRSDRARPATAPASVVATPDGAPVPPALRVAVVPDPV